MDEKLILASRDDGLGERLRAVLNALYLAKRFDLKFGFVWHYFKTSPSLIAGNKLAPICMLENIDKFCYNDKFNNAKDEFNRFKRKSVNEFIKTPALNPPYRITQKRLDTIFSDIDTKEYKESLVKIFDEIDFHKDIKALFQKARDKISALKRAWGGISALHIRAGDHFFKSAIKKPLSKIISITAP